jgi:hypothetical protein
VKNSGGGFGPRRFYHIVLKPPVKILTAAFSIDSKFWVGAVPVIFADHKAMFVGSQSVAPGAARFKHLRSQIDAVVVQQFGFLSVR